MTNLDAASTRMLNLHVFRTREITKLILHFLRQKLLCEKVQRIIGTNICHSNIENIFSVVLCLRLQTQKPSNYHPQKSTVWKLKVHFHACLSNFPLYIFLYKKKCLFWASVTRDTALCLPPLEAMNACLVAHKEHSAKKHIFLVYVVNREWE